MFYHFKVHQEIISEILKHLDFSLGTSCTINLNSHYIHNFFLDTVCMIPPLLWSLAPVILVVVFSQSVTGQKCVVTLVTGGKLAGGGVVGQHVLFNLGEGAFTTTTTIS